MKKFVFLLFVCLFMYFIYDSVGANTIIIPNSAIRFRIIPNSNSSVDIMIKEKVMEYLEDDFYKLLENVEDIDKARDVIKSNIDNLENNIDNIFISNNYISDYNINFGYNYFPEKEYENVKYNEGYYESLVITIGEGNGNNWWCVLFPNLCLVDTKKLNDAEYKSWVMEVINKLF